ncbi:hypothetical protein Droror1_Dr00021891 [Drosera rotundifolia]
MKFVNCVGISSGEPTRTPTIKTINLFSMPKFLELKDPMPQGLPIESSPKKSVQYQVALVSGLINRGIHERVKHAMHASNAKYKAWIHSPRSASNNFCSTSAPIVKIQILFRTRGRVLSNKEGRIQKVHARCYRKFMHCL